MNSSACAFGSGVAPFVPCAADNWAQNKDNVEARTRQSDVRPKVLVRTSKTKVCTGHFSSFFFFSGKEKSYSRCFLPISDRYHPPNGVGEEARFSMVSWKFVA